MYINSNWLLYADVTTWWSSADQGANKVILLNACISESNYVEQSKVTKIIQLFEKGNDLNIDNYRLTML